MCKCLQIRFIQSQEVLDTFNRQQVETNRSLLELDDLDSIQTDFSITSTLPATSKNKRLLCIANPLAKISPSEIEVMTDKGKLDVKKITITAVNKGGIEVSITGTIVWVDELRALKLKDLDLGQIDVFSDIDMYHKWLDGLWLDGNDIYNYPVVYYRDRWSRGTNWAALWEIRPYFAPLPILRAIFCKLGYEFYSPVLECDHFRRSWLYLLAKDFYNYPGKGRVQKARAEKTSATLDYRVAGSDVLFDDSSTAPNEDPGSHWTASYLYDNIYQATLRLKVDINMQICDNVPATGGWAGDVVGIQGVIFRAASATTITLDPITVVAEVDGGCEELIGTYEIELLPNDTFHIVVVAPTGYDVQDGSFIQFSSIEQGLTYSDIIQIKDIMDPALISSEFIKGMMHLCKGKLIIDSCLKTAAIYHPEGAGVFDCDNVEAFYQSRNYQDYTAKIDCDSLQYSYPNNAAESVLIEFQEVDDPFIDPVKAEKFNILPAHSFLYGNTASDRNRVKSPNPFFRATVNRYSWDKNNDTLPFYAFLHDFPVMWDNVNGVENSFDIGQRIVWWAATGEERGVGRSTPTAPKFFQLENDILTSVPLTMQHSFLIEDSSGLQIGLAKLVYGGWPGMYHTLSNEFYKNWIGEVMENQVVITASFRACGGNYHAPDFLRTRWLAKVLGSTTMMNLIELKINGCNAVSEAILMPFCPYHPLCETE